MRHIWQWFCGYVCIIMNGRQVNRFLNLCSRNGIHLWRISYDINHTLRANLKLRDFYDLKPYLRKTKTRIRICSKKGFPFWCFRHPRLKWFLCIVICFLSIGFYSLNFVWNIEITGNQNVSTEEIIECLISHEIDIGLKKEQIDCSKIERLLREHFQEMGWVSVYLEHTNLCIDIKESLYDTMEPIENEQSKQYHLIANKDATIYSIITRAGTPVITKGQKVKKGDLLVLGQNEILDDAGEVKEILYYKAEAQIIGDVLYEVEIPFTEIELLSIKIANQNPEKLLLGLGYHKLQQYTDRLQLNGVLILETSGRIEKKEKNICFRAKIYVREQIGINIPVEEVRENEFE